MAKFYHLATTNQLNRSWIESELFPICDTFRTNASYDQTMKRIALYCLFYEPSFLTRTSFERAIELLGGTAYHTEDASQFFPIPTPNHVDNVIRILDSLHMDLVVLRSSEIGVIEKASKTDAMPVINAGSLEDHPTQALADIYTLNHELGGVDGIKIAIFGRLEHRNVSALLKGLAFFDNVKVTLIPISGQADPNIVNYCERLGMNLTVSSNIDAASEVDAVYLNAPRTVAHAQLLKSRAELPLRIDKKFMSMLKPNSVILDPMQRSGDFSIEIQDKRLAFYRQAENALYIRMAILQTLLC